MSRRTPIPGPRTREMQRGLRLRPLACNPAFSSARRTIAQRCLTLAHGRRALPGDSLVLVCVRRRRVQVYRTQVHINFPVQRASCALGDGKFIRGHQALSKLRVHRLLTCVCRFFCECKGSAGAVSQRGTTANRGIGSATSSSFGCNQALVHVNHSKGRANSYRNRLKSWKSCVTNDILAECPVLWPAPCSALDVE
jgi:hypothetical protein